MARGPLVSLGEAARACGAGVEVLRAWAEQDGVGLIRSGQEEAVSRRALRACLLRRDLPVPAELDDWPRVLIADDDPDVLQVVSWIVRQACPDAVVATAKDGERALDEVLAFKPHLIVTDFRMPKYDGATLCRMIRDCRQLRGAKVLALTGFVDERTRREFLESGAAEFVAKPIDPPEVKRAVLRLLGFLPI